MYSYKEVVMMMMKKARHLVGGGVYVVCFDSK